MLNLSTGKTEHLIPMDAEYPSLVIDEGNNKVYENSGDRLVALPLESPGAVYAVDSKLASHPSRPGLRVGGTRASGHE